MAMQQSINFVDMHVVERDCVYFASRLDKLDSREYVHSRMVVYDAQSEKKWYFHDAEINVVSVCAKRRSDVEGRKLCALSKEGEIEFFSNKDSTSRIEKIAGAGVRLGTRGYVSRIKEIGARLFVCGGNNQIYQRRALDWELISGGDLSLMDTDETLDDILSDSIDDSRSSGMLNDIVGFDENNLFCVGDQGVIARYNGTTWVSVVSPTTEHLNAAVIDADQIVWICGHNGTLLRGGLDGDFKDVSAVEDNAHFRSVAVLDKTVFLSSEDGLFQYGGEAIKRVSPPAPSDTYRVMSSGGVLWSVGSKEISCFAEGKWGEISHPDNT
jgi:hypothetical protein